MAKRLNPDAFNAWVYDIIDDYSHRLEVYYGGAGSGKELQGLPKSPTESTQPSAKGAGYPKVGATLKHSIFQLFLDLLEYSGFYSSARINRSDFQITLTNGSQIIFKGLDDPERSNRSQESPIL